MLCEEIKHEEHVKEPRGNYITMLLLLIFDKQTNHYDGPLSLSEQTQVNNTPETRLNLPK